jgi:hypothetical protein
MRCVLSAHHRTRTHTHCERWEGKGTFYWSNGSYYVGRWRDDKPVGQGVHWCATTKSKTKRGWSNEFLCCATATVLTPMKETTTGTTLHHHVLAFASVSR